MLPVVEWEEDEDSALKTGPRSTIEAFNSSKQADRVRSKNVIMIMMIPKPTKEQGEPPGKKVSMISAHQI